MSPQLHAHQGRKVAYTNPNLYVVFPVLSRFFLKRAPFTVAGGVLTVDALKPAYQVLDSFHHGSVDNYPSVMTITAESKQLQEFQDLFELYVSDYLVLQRCSEELLYLKSLWDMVRLSSSSRTRSNAINVRWACSVHLPKV